MHTVSQETVNHELQPSTEEFNYIHDQLFSAMHEAFERLNATNGEVVPITREGAQGYFFYYTSPDQTISELYLKPATGAKPQAGSAQQLSQQLLVETCRTCPDGEERRLRYHEYDPTGAECVIYVNPTGELQYDSTNEIDTLITNIQSHLENFKLLERAH